MARKRRLTIGVINITMHPHKPERYVDLIKAAVTNRCVSSIGNLQSVLITSVGSFELGNDKPDAILRGNLVKFQNIDFDGNWFDTESNAVAAEQDLASVNIPPNLKPNSMFYDFVFFPDKHLLVYEAKSKDSSITPAVAVKAFTNIFNQSALQDEFGVIEVTHIPETHLLDNALALKNISNIKLHITRPNADSFAKIERQYLQQMNDGNVAEIIEERRAIKGESLVIDEDLRNSAKIAEKNGYAEVRGHDSAGKPINFSTLSHPIQITDYFDGDKETVLSFLFKMAVKFINGAK